VFLTVMVVVSSVLETELLERELPGKELLKTEGSVANGMTVKV
jgi:hypothetical protein